MKYFNLEISSVEKIKRYFKVWRTFICGFFKYYIRQMGNKTIGWTQNCYQINIVY